MNSLKKPSEFVSPLRRWLTGWLPLWTQTAIVFRGCIMPASQIPHFLVTINDKIVHAGMFFILYLLAEHAFRLTMNWVSRHSSILAFTYTILMGIATETAQFFVASRHADAVDLGADALGAFLAALCLGIFQWRRYRTIPAWRLLQAKKEGHGACELF